MSPNSAGAPTTAISNPCEAVKKSTINQELWQACAGPLVNLPPAGTHVVYFPQGHSEQVAASLKKDVDTQIPNYPNLPSKLLCRLHSVTLHADPETDEVYAQMTLQPVPSFDKDALLRSDLSLKSNKPQTEFFCKTLTASDTSTHGGFSVPRRAAEKIFPPLDFSMQPPAQELVSRDLHDTLWTFRHIYRGQPKRHLLTTGWSLFVSGKRLFSGDSVLFIRDEKQQLLLGIRRANRQPTNLSSSVLSSDSMHIGILAAAAHAAANNSPFTIFYNPRASLSEFVIPLAKYYKAVNSYQISLGMRFRMMFETEESGTRRYMGTITGISDLDTLRWKNSQWRNLQVGWDESTASERRNRVSVWEIEPVTAPFFICPPPFFRAKRPRQPGMPDDDSSDMENLFKRAMPWMSDDMFMKDSQALPGLSLMQWMNMQQNSSLANSIQPNYMPSLPPGPVLQNYPPQLGFSSQQHIPQQNNIQFEAQRPPQQVQQLVQLAKVPSTLNTLGSITQHQQQLGNISQQTRQTLTSQVQVQNQNIIVQPPLIQDHQLHKNLPQTQQIQQQQQQHQIMGKSLQQHQIMGQSQPPDQITQQQIQTPEHQIQLQMFQKKLQQQQQQQQQLLPSQQSTFQQQSSQVNPLQDQERHQQIDMSQSFCRPVIPSQMLDVPQAATTSLAQSQMMSNGNNQAYDRLSTPSQQQAVTVPDFPSINNNQLARSGSSILTGAGWGHSVIREDIPTCSTLPSTNNGQNTVPQNMNHKVQQNTVVGEDMASSTTAALLHANNFGIMPSNTNYAIDLQQKTEVKPLVNISKCQNEGLLVAPQTYLNVAAAQTDFLDTSSSATSVCLSLNDMQYQQQTNNVMPFNPQSMLFRDTSQNEEVLADSRINISFGTNLDGNVPLNPENLLTKSLMGLEKDFSNSIPLEDLPTYENSKVHQQEISSSIVSQSFGVPDMTYNSIDSTIDDNSFWASQPPQQFQRMRTYTKVYKRGAVGRSIDISRYMGYDDLKQDLARRFGIEGQLEDRHRVGWKLVYVDHENDVLLVGDDPWEEFVSFVRCIKILSPQEVQLMRLDEDFGSSVLNNQACSSSDNGKA